MLERAMWRRAKKLHTVREDDLQKVTAELAKADDGDGLLTVAEFRNAWARLGLPLTDEEAAQLIRRGARSGRQESYQLVTGVTRPHKLQRSHHMVSPWPASSDPSGPRDPDGRCRYEAYVRNLLQGQSRALGNSLVCKGYPVTDGDFSRKIVYPRCRTARLHAAPPMHARFFP